jgi:glutathione peroxidase
MTLKIRSTVMTPVRIGALFAVALAAGFTPGGNPARAATAVADAAPLAKGAVCPPLLQRQALRLQDEKPQALCQYAGKVLLIVNTASLCGYTPQYQGLESLYSRYRARGLVVLGFPSNDFGGQEPGDHRAIASFCENTFGVKFPMFAKTRVKAGPGGPLDPLFADLQQRSGQAPGWNFHKYLVSRDGRQVVSFSSDTDPLDPRLTNGVEKFLGAQ